MENLQAKQARSVAAGGAGAFRRVWVGAVWRGRHAGDGVVGGVPGGVVARGAGEPRVGEDVVHGEAAGGVAAQQGGDEVAGAGADPLRHLEVPAPNLGEQRGRVGVVEGIPAGERTR